MHNSENNGKVNKEVNYYKMNTLESDIRKLLAKIEKEIADGESMEKIKAERIRLDELLEEYIDKNRNNKT